MSIIEKDGSLQRLMKNHTAANTSSDVLSRNAYVHHTVYVKNPGGVPITVEVSPDREFWVPTATAATGTALKIEVPSVAPWLRITRGAGAGTVDAWVASGGIAE